MFIHSVFTILGYVRSSREGEKVIKKGPNKENIGAVGETRNVTYWRSSVMTIRLPRSVQRFLHAEGTALLRHQIMIHGDMPVTYFLSVVTTHFTS